MTGGRIPAARRSGRTGRDRVGERADALDLDGDGVARAEKHGRAAGEAEWITVADYPGRNIRPWWSPDSNLLYFLSQKDSHPCIWAQSLNPATKHPVGEPFAVYHFHETRRGPPMEGTAGFGPAIAKDRIIFSLSEQTGNIWLAELEN